MRPVPRIESPSVSSYKFEQRRLIHRGREFHFVSYDAQIANERRGEVAMPPMWYLMNEGKRRPVMEQVPGMPIEELDRARSAASPEAAIAHLALSELHLGRMKELSAPVDHPHLRLVD